jgi:hypothetical protein
MDFNGYQIQSFQVELRQRDEGVDDIFQFVMPGLVPGIHVLTGSRPERRGWPGQARP